MKIARVFLTATILFSLKSTLFCSEQLTEETIQITRKNSGIHHDGTRDGLFGSGFDTLKNIREKKHYGKQPYGMGSDSQAPQRWGKVGQQITKLEDAQTFMAEVKRLESFGLFFPEESLEASQVLIEAEKARLENIKIAAEAEKVAAFQAQFDKADDAYFNLNQKSKALLYAFYIEKTTTRKNEDRALDLKYADLLKAERAELKKSRKQKDSELIAQLAIAFDQLETIKTDQNNSNPSHKISRLPFVATQDNINEDNLGQLAHKYKTWTPKNKTYAQAAQSDK